MKDKLLREAIADAKLIRDTAIANARAQLEEAFKPQIASALSAKLRNEIEELEGDDMMEQHDLDSSDIGTGITVDNPGPKNPSKVASDSSDIDNPKQEFAPKTGKEGPNSKPTSVNENDEFDMDPDAMSADPEGLGGLEGGMDSGMGEPDGDEMGGDDFDLEAIIAQLEADVAGDVGEPEAPAMEGFDDPMAGMKVDGPITVQKETVNVGDKDANSASKDGKAPTPTADGVNGGKEVKPGTPVADHEQLGEDLTLEEILREVEAEDDHDDKKPWESEKIATENVELKSQLREHRDVIVYLRGKLHEVNMLNAKLMFTNKLFRGFDLNGTQKKSIVETFDRATTMREVKLIYTTLAESFAGKTGGKAVRKPNATSITEGLASKPVSSTKPKAQPLNESTDNAGEDEFRRRMQKLAGISIFNK